MSDNTEQQVAETEVDEVEEADVEAHSASVLPLQGLGTPEDGVVTSKSTFSIGC